MVKIHAVKNGQKYDILVLCADIKRRMDVPDELIRAKEARSKIFRHDWIRDQEAKGNAFMRALDDKHTLLAINVPAAVRDLGCTELSLIRTIGRRFHSVTVSKREQFPKAFEILECNGFATLKFKMKGRKIEEIGAASPTGPSVLPSLPLLPGGSDLSCSVPSSPSTSTKSARSPSPSPCSPYDAAAVPIALVATEPARAAPVLVPSPLRSPRAPLMCPEVFHKQSLVVSPASSFRTFPCARGPVAAIDDALILAAKARLRESMQQARALQA
eukprot:m51a1_g5707 hypothetical protein (272) ;mRNA; f:1069855-1071022